MKNKLGIDKTVSCKYWTICDRDHDCKADGNCPIYVSNPHFTILRQEKYDVGIRR